MKRIINALLIMAVLVSASSCMQEIGPNNPTGNGDTDMVIHVRTPEGFGGPGARSAFSDADENTINDIYVLVFNSAGTLVDVKKGEVDVLTTPGSPNPPNYSGGGRFTVSLTASASTSDADKFRIVVLANAAEILDADLKNPHAAIPGGRGYANVISRIWEAVDGKMFQTSVPAEKRIPMWGETEPITINEAGRNQTIDLTRAVARVDVGVGRWTGTTWNGKHHTTGEDIPFELTSIHVARKNKGYALIPATANRGKHAVHNTFLATGPTVPTADKFDIDNDLKNFRFNVTGSTMREIYIPEANVRMGATSPGGNGHLDRMAIIVGGKYKGGVETFYRLDFARRVVNGNDFVLIDVLRNHLYRFDIASVTGPGYPDPETAYKNLSMNINVNVVEWEEEPSEIIVEGTHWIKLFNSRNENRDDRTAILYRYTEITDIIPFHTTIPMDRWALSLSHGGAFPDVNNKTVIENERFRVELLLNEGTQPNSDGVYTGYFKFTAKKALNEASSVSDNPSTLSILALDRVKFSFTILQRGSHPDDWLPGGSEEVVVGGPRP
ncbi:MAG: FimB/Mfa2 family fimbrial subunit [Dysgonamonadaceae bacterium]|nr:FimB/Mfa2 family fimbrial subunit [Dysgonamonadaceae bacterium]